MILTADSVAAVRARMARAHEQTAARFRDVFVLGQTPPTAHLELLAGALIDGAGGLRVNGRAFRIRDGLIVPDLDAFDVDRTPEAVFEYWMIVSEITGSAAWHMTSVIASAEEYAAALKRMDSPQIVRALVTSWLPSADWRTDGTALLEVTLYTRADEERIERRQLLLDPHNEFHVHGRELIAEGRGGISAQ
ncbi:MAG TPA: hypothetical protein VKH35_17640 [Thermoanaerobaculia bacterium]|nr:hypothetical protein [Thermoanaerobaculia bacterium]